MLMYSSATLSVTAYFSLGIEGRCVFLFIYLFFYSVVLMDIVVLTLSDLCIEVVPKLPSIPHTRPFPLLSEAATIVPSADAFRDLHCKTLIYR